MCSGSRADGHWSPVASVPTLDASSCDEPRKGVVDRRPGTHRFAGVRRNPSHFTFYLPLRPRCRGISHTQPHVACFMKVQWQALDSMQRVVILPLVASLAFFIAFSSCKADAAPNRISTCARSSPILYTS